MHLMASHEAEAPLVASFEINAPLAASMGQKAHLRLVWLVDLQKVLPGHMVSLKVCLVDLENVLLDFEDGLILMLQAVW